MTGLRTLWLIGEQCRRRMCSKDIKSDRFKSKVLPNFAIHFKGFASLSSLIQIRSFTYVKSQSLETQIKGPQFSICVELRVSPYGCSSEEHITKACKLRKNFFLVSLEPAAQFVVHFIALLCTTKFIAK